MSQQAWGNLLMVSNHIFIRGRGVVLILGRSIVVLYDLVATILVTSIQTAWQNERWPILQNRARTNPIDPRENFYT